MMAPNFPSAFSCSLVNAEQQTGPTKSGMNISKHMTLLRMKKNPNNVTIFGASHNGSNSTKAFHCVPLSISSLPTNIRWKTYVMFEDVIRDQRFIDTGVLIALEMNERVFGHAFMRSLSYQNSISRYSLSNPSPTKYPKVDLLLLGVIGETGVVTGDGNRACGSVLTASKLRLEGRILKRV